MLTQLKYFRAAFLLLLSLIIAGISGLTHAQSLRPLSQTFLKSLADIDIAADQAAKAIQSVKAENLKLSAREQKYLEGIRERATKSVDLVRKQTNLLRNRENLQGLFALKIVVSGFERQLASLISWAYRLEFRRDSDPPARLSSWIDLLERSADSLDLAVFAFDQEAFELLVNADNILSNRSGGR